MSQEAREDIVRSVIAEYVNSHPITEIRDWYSLRSVARRVVQRLEAEGGIWTKWNPPREALVKSAIGCWVPLEDLRAFLNAMPGPELTPTDVAQRMRAFSEEDFDEPNPALKDACLAIFAEEKAQGTELAAIIGRLREYTEAEEGRLMREQWALHAKSDDYRPPIPSIDRPGAPINVRPPIPIINRPPIPR